MASSIEPLPVTQERETMSFAVTTGSYDNARTGSNPFERVLTPEAVRQRGLRRLFPLTLPADARGCNAQPLIVPGVKMRDGTVHDVVYVATLGNHILAFDANSGAELWKVHLGPPVCDSGPPDRPAGHGGILSTPVIDLRTPLLYVCAWTSAVGSRQGSRHVLHALKLQDGCDAHPPLHFDGVTHDAGHGRPLHHLHCAALQQRAALLLTDAALFVAFGRIDEDASGRGWLVAVDLATFRVAAAWSSTAQGNGGDILQSGAGPAADAAGDVYVMTGRGDFDAVSDFGESIVKLKYSPPSGGVAGTLSVTDWWTPWTDAARGGRELGRAGPTLSADTGSILASMSDGILYTVNAASLGQSQSGDLAPEHAARNYARLQMQPIFYTYFPGWQPSPDPVDAARLVFRFADRTFHLHGAPVLWRSADNGLTHYCWGENGNLRAWSLGGGGTSTYLGCSSEWASEKAAAPPGGIPGGTISLSANGHGGGIVWGCIPYGDSRQGASAGRLLAYDAQHFDRYPNGFGSMPALWDSQSWDWHFLHNGFSPPVVWNGRIYLVTHDEVWVLGLA